MNYLTKTETVADKKNTGTIANRAGGRSFMLTQKELLDQFLLLGCEGGTYYAKQEEILETVCKSTIELIKLDGPYVVNRVMEISAQGRAPKNDPALFALALCASKGDAITKKMALEALPVVARIPTHLFLFASYIKKMRGWGRGLRRAVANWYLGMPEDKMAYYSVKYQQRGGWAHKDLLLLSHPQKEKLNPTLRLLLDRQPEGELPPIIPAHNMLLENQSSEEVVQILRGYKSLTGQAFPWEGIPTQHLKFKEVWEEIMPLPATALIRNLGRLTANGYLAPFSKGVDEVCAMLSNNEWLKKARVHPTTILQALVIYRAGKGDKGSLTWSPVDRIIGVLEDAFDRSFSFLEPTGKKLVIGVDVSGSMGWSGSGSLSPSDIASVMAMIMARREPNSQIVCFDTETYDREVHARDSFSDVVRKLKFGGGGTDCSLPVKWAMDKGISVDAFLVLTDSEQWVGQRCDQAIFDYHRKINPDAKLICISAEASTIKLTPPNDKRFLFIAGWDNNIPDIINDFLKS